MCSLGMSHITKLFATRSCWDAQYTPDARPTHLSLRGDLCSGKYLGGVEGECREPRGEIGAPQLSTLLPPPPASQMPAPARRRSGRPARGLLHPERGGRLQPDLLRRRRLQLPDSSGPVAPALISLSLYIYIYICVCYNDIHLSLSLYLSISIYIYICIYIYIYVYIYIYIYVYT